MADNKNSLFGNISTNLFNLGQNKGPNLFGAQSNNTLFTGSLFGDKGTNQSGLNFNNMNIFGKKIEKEEKKDGENNQSLSCGSKLFNFNVPKNDENNTNIEKNNMGDNNQLNSLFFKSNNKPGNVNINVQNVSNIQNVGNVHVNIGGYKIEIENIKKEENVENYNESNEEEEEEIKKEEKDKKEDKEKIEEEKVSEELNKPDELNSVDNREYLDLINKKIKYYKNEIDTTINKIEENKKELIQQEKKFNNIKDLINISQKVINYIEDSIDNNTRQLEDICGNQEKIINDLDRIEENLNKRIRSSENKNEILKENKDKNNDIQKTFNSIEEKIQNCYKKMTNNNSNININNNPKTLNDLLGRMYWKIKKDIHGKEANLINDIYNIEKNCTIDK